LCLNQSGLSVTVQSAACLSLTFYYYFKKSAHFSSRGQMIETLL